MHELLKEEISEAVEIAAIALRNANEKGDDKLYEKHLESAVGYIHQLYAQYYRLERSTPESQLTKSVSNRSVVPWCLSIQE